MPTHVCVSHRLIPACLPANKKLPTQTDVLTANLHPTASVRSDSLELKNLILEGSLKNTTTTRILPLMTAEAGGEDETLSSEAQLVNTVAEMGILAGSACLVAEYGSGFSTHARLWGSPSLWARSSACYRSTMECIKEGGGGNQPVDGVRPFPTYTNVSNASGM